MNLRKRLLVILLIIVVSGVPLLSLLYIDVNLKHECTGIECQICAHIEAAIQNVNHFKNLFLSSIFFLTAVLATANISCVRTIISRSGVTLITLKVELLN